MRVTTKGQVTIPLEIRRALGITPGTELSFRLRGSRIEVEKSAGAGRGAEVVRRLRGAPGWTGLTTDELMSLTRDPAP
jgi:antitoxin PrlF